MSYVLAGESEPRFSHAYTNLRFWALLAGVSIVVGEEPQVDDTDFVDCQCIASDPHSVRDV